MKCKFWRITLILHDDCDPEGLTSDEVEKILDDIDLPAGIRATNVSIEEVPCE